MKLVWSEEGKLARWLEVELAALDAWAEIGAVPAEAAGEVRERAVAPTPERVAEIEERTQHDLAAFVDAVAEGLGDSGRWLHYGLTSSDVLDTATALQVREAGALVLDGVDRALEAVVVRAEEHRDTAMAGRTHGVHAEPITFGAKLAGWAFELERDRERLARALEGMRVGKLAGAVGTYGGGDPEVERLACERLGLVPEPAATQVVPRDRYAELLSALAVTAASLDRFATRSAISPAPRFARCRSRFEGPEGLIGDAAQAEPGRRGANLRPRPRRARGRRRRLRERRPLARARHLPLERGAGGSP